MSGIAGIYFLDGRPVDRLDVERMVESIAHRGTDGSGVWTDGRIGLGHRMLWTTPESIHEKLPMVNKTGDSVITADARIDNREELINALNFNGKPRETISDSEIILAAYEKWGEPCPEKLLGDFAFAIWDKRKQALFCARDPIGIKPFYYYFNGKTFRWASEPKAIFEDKTIPKEPNLSLVSLYLLDRFDEREETLYKNIYRLPPSHFMVLENGHLRKGQYWDIDPEHTIRYQTDAEYAEHFLGLFKETVRALLRSHRPVGALLSGGLDSSSIVCTAQMLCQEKFIPNEFETFSHIFDEFPCDERFYIDEVVRKWDVKANYVTHEKNLSWVDFEKVHEYPDVAYFPTLFLHGSVLKDAQQKGIRVMLNGIGGDDLLAVDVDHLTDLMLKGHIRKLMVQLRHDSILYSRSPYSLFLNYCLKPLLPRPMKVALKTLLKPFYGNGIPSWINADFLKKTGVIDRIKSKQKFIRFPTRAQQHIYEALRFGWNANIALDMVERFTAHFDIESRHPFFDRRLVEFLLAIPEEQRWSEKWTKAVLRQAMDGILPERIKMRKDKAEFSCVLNSEYKERQYYKVKELIQKSHIAALGVIHIDCLQQLFESYCNGKAPDNVINILEKILWLELWYRPAMGVP